MILNQPIYWLINIMFVIYLILELPFVLKEIMTGCQILRVFVFFFLYPLNFSPHSLPLLNHFLRSPLGTPSFLSPELCKIDGNPRGCPADVWALGVSLYYLIFADLPFKGNSLAELYDEICEKEVCLIKKIREGVREGERRLLVSY